MGAKLDQRRRSRGGSVIGLAVQRPLFLLLLLEVLPLVFLSWRLWPAPLQPRRRLLTLVARVALMSLHIFALAGIRLTTAANKRAMVAVVQLWASLRGNVDQRGRFGPQPAGGQGTR